MPRKTKAELAAERGEQDQEIAENGEMVMEETARKLPEEPVENPDAEPDAPVSEANSPDVAGDNMDTGLQENAIAGLLASYSEAAENESASEPHIGFEQAVPDGGNMPEGDGVQQADAPAEDAGTNPPPTDAGEPVGMDISGPQDNDEQAEGDATEKNMSIEDAQSAEPNRPAETSSNTPRRPSFFQINFRELDRDLSAEQMQEWNSIYASYRSKSILTGTVIGVDDNRFDVTNPQTGLAERRTVRSLVIIGYRVKVLIPESEVWASGEERPDYVMREMVGAKVDYVVMQVDREGECAIASRRSALAKQRRHFMAVRGGHDPGETLTCNVLVVGPRRVLVECGGYDITLSQRDLSWTAISDLRQEYRPGQELPCKLKEYSAREGKLSISVRDVTPNPFIGAENRHPIGSRRFLCYPQGVF